MSVSVTRKYLFISRNNTVHLTEMLDFLNGKGLYSWLEFDDELTRLRSCYTELYGRS